LSDLDLQVRRGLLSDLVDLPSVIGYEISGVVQELGSEVKNLAIGDEVVGIVPLDCASGGYAEFIVLPFHCVVKKSSIIPHEDAAAVLSGLVRAYTAFHYLMKLVAGETVLILNGASAYGLMAVQLAGTRGFRILTTAEEEDESNHLNDLATDIVRVIYPNRENLLEVVIEETGGLGVAGIIDDSWLAVREESPGATRVSTDILIRCLAAHGTLVTSSPDVRLDAAQARLLYLKGASLAFLFDQAWLLASIQKGRLLHIITDLLDHLQSGKIQVKISKTFPLEKIREAHRHLEVTRLGKIIIKP
jgi:NADPH:quinone reductase-like Zn-dependent oxidoreductase